MLTWWRLRKLRSILCNPKELAGQLIKSSDPRVVDILIKKLKHRNDNVRAHAASILGHIGDKRAISPLLETIARETDSFSWYCAACALASMGETEIIPIMASALRSGKKELQANAASVLGHFKHGDAVKVLMGTLEDPDSELVWTVAIELCRMGEPRSIRTLLRYVHDINKSKAVVESIYKIIEQKGSEVQTEDLLLITRLEGLREHYGVSWCGEDGKGYGCTGYRLLDCSKLKEVAGQELARRDIPY